MKYTGIALLLFAFATATGAAPDTWSEPIDGFPVHIYENPQGTRKGSERGVLILGAFSDAEKAIADAKRLINPATGRPYDVIIGVGRTGMPEKPLGTVKIWKKESRQVLGELSRVFLDHRNAEKNGRAVKKGIEKYFKGPLVAATVDMHSNGTPVGINALEMGAFRQVEQMNIMGPDIGHAGRYVTEKRLNAMKDRGVKQVHIHRVKGDLVPSLGRLTEALALAGRPLAGTIAKKVRDAVSNYMGLSAAGGKADSIIRVHDYDQPEDKRSELVGSHLVKRYIALRAIHSRDPELINKTRDLMGDDEFDREVGIKSPKGKSPKGVRIHFEERILAEVLEKGTAADVARMLADLGRGLREAPTAKAWAGALARVETLVKARFRAARDTRPIGDLRAVSLMTLVSRAEKFAGRWRDLPAELRYPGGLTRIHGYVISGDDVILLGRREAGVPPLAVDDLVVGIRAVWKENRTPLVSLDPDPADIEGDPRARVQGIPRDSGFALTMLDADYAMKRIMAGLEPVGVLGYRTLREALRDTRRSFLSRFWLYPVQPGVGDIQVSPDASTAIFLGGVQVLSEQMMLLKEGLVGTGETIGPAQEAARSFTIHYDAIAAEKPVFRRLQGLFDVVLLGRIWRNRRLTSPILERLCALPHRPVDVPAAYQAIRVVIRREGGMEYYLQGGVQAKVGAGRRTWLPLEDEGLRALRKRTVAAAASGEVAAPVPGVTVQAAAPSTASDASSLLLSAAVTGLLRGELDAALAAANQLLESNPWDAEAFVIRALIHLRRSDYERARRDAERALDLDGESPVIGAATSEILFQCCWIEGDPEAALRETERSLDFLPDGSRAQVARGEALQLLDRPAEAREAFLQAAELDPGSAAPLARLAQLELGEGRTLAAKPWIERARALQPDLPEVRIAQAFWQVAIIRPDLAEETARGVWEDSAAGPTARLQALVVLAAVSASREKWKDVDRYVSLMDGLVAGSPEVLVTAAEIAFTWGEPERGEAYLRKAESLAPRHPLVQKLRARRSSGMRK